MQLRAAKWRAREQVQALVQEAVVSLLVTPERDTGGKPRGGRILGAGVDRPGGHPPGQRDPLGDRGRGLHSGYSIWRYHKAGFRRGPPSLRFRHPASPHVRLLRLKDEDDPGIISGAPRFKKADMLRTILSLVLISSGAFLNLCPGSVWAQSVDQLLVVDDADVFGNRIDQVQAAASSLQRLGADIRVRTIPTYGSAGSLDRFVEQLESRSPSWTGQDDERKNNLVVLVIALQERQTGLYYGAYWEEILGGTWLRIQTDIMNPLFREGDYAGGAIEGLEEIQRLIAAGAQPQSTSRPGTGRSGGWTVLIVLVGIFGLVLGLVLIVRGSRKRKKLQAARQRALLPKQAAASGINELIETIQMLEIKVDVMADKVTPEEAAPLREGLARARTLIDQSSQTYSELSHSAGDPENPTLGDAQIALIEAEYQQILDKLRQARETIKEVEERVSGIQQAVGGFPGKAAEVAEAIEGALRQQEQLEKDGFSAAYPASLVAKGREALKEAQALVARKRLSEGMKRLDQAAEQVSQAVQAGEELPRRKQEAAAAIPALSARIERVKEAIIQGKGVFERLFQDYAPGNWESIQGNGTEAENRVNWASGALADARAAAEGERQEWHRVLELVEQGNGWLTEAESLVKSIAELETNLTEERRKAPEEIRAAQADVAAAWAYINRYDEDIRESLEDDLRAAETKNETARGELEREKPDYFEACRLAREANEAADKILVEARSEHEAAERMRAKASSAWRQASARVSMASKYLDNHRLAVGTEAARSLASAVRALREAEAAVDAQVRIALIQQAELAADQAYAMARRDVAGAFTQTPRMGGPTILIPPMGRPMGRPTGGGPSWGSRRSSLPGLGGATRRGGGGFSSWSAGGRTIGGGGRSRGGGGSTGW